MNSLTTAETMNTALQAQVVKQQEIQAYDFLTSIIPLIIGTAAIIITGIFELNHKKETDL